MPIPLSQHILSLRDIASWQFQSPLHPQSEENLLPPIVAAIPSLQRGAVWKPGQVEILWDSILRGFPVGALVVCRKFEGQHHHGGKYGDGRGKEFVTHYLLDGQQRCNAIALGFLDALEKLGEQEPMASLWIDLQPKIPQNSTRRFVLRMLTTAHPWGYTLDDEAAFIGVSAVRSALENCKEAASAQNAPSFKGKRPPLTSAWPHHSQCPIPFSWLLKAAFLQTEENAFWNEVLENLKQCGKGETCWVVCATDIIQTHVGGSKRESSLSELFQALQRASHFRLVALEAPQEVLRDDRRDDSTVPGSERVQNVEHLFQRLNSAGTVLRGEELLFSMVKAYWPAIETSFDQIKDRDGNAFLPMPGWRLATLGIRAAQMAFRDRYELASPLSVPQVRKLAVNDDAVEERGHIQGYLGITSAQLRDGSAGSSDLHRNLRQVDEWLLYSEDNKTGLPPVLRSALARAEPDLYLLLLHMAQIHRKSAATSFDPSLTKCVTALATLMHWFGSDSAKTARHVFGVIKDKGLTRESFREIFSDDTPGIFRVMPPKNLTALLTADDDLDLDADKLSKWNFWHSLVERQTDPVDRALVENNIWPFIHKLIYSRPLLLYAQRDFMSRAFATYDPSCVDICNGHDRPWDYDHILPSAVLYRKHNQEFKSVCNAWLGTIGNLRAWPLEENRSKSDEEANKCILSREQKDDSLIEGEECDAFSIREGDISDMTKVVAFARTARKRLLRIYECWYDGLEIGYLIKGQA